MRQETLKENAYFSDRIPFLYVEHATIKQKDSSISIWENNTEIPLPIGSIAALILGPGTSVSHRAIEALSDSGCLLVWAGADFAYWFASGQQKDRSANNIQLQATCWANPRKHMQVVCWMYDKRFCGQMAVHNKSLETLRGEEGQRMKELYKQVAQQYNVTWTGRQYNKDNFWSQEPIQQLITVGNQLLYNVCHAAILCLGFSPSLGFIHTGKMLSFVYDLADLYKADIVLPTAFKKTPQEFSLTCMGR